MLKTIEEWLNAVPWLAYVVISTFGGIVAYVRRFEKDVNIRIRTIRQHSWGIVRQAAMSAFAGLLFYFSMESFSIKPPLAFAFAGIVGHFGAEFLEMLWASVKGRLLIQKERYDPRDPKE